MFCFPVTFKFNLHLYLCQLQKAGCGKEGLDVVLLHHDAGGVAEVDQDVHRCLVHVSDSDLCLAGL